MKKIFAQNILLLLLVNLMIKPLWIFGIDLQVQKVLGHEIYGSYQTFVSFCIIFQILLDMGLQHYANRSIARSPNAFYTLFPNIMVAKLGLSTIYLLVIGLAAFLFQYSFSQILFLTSVACIQIVQSFYLFLRSNIAAKQLYKTDSFLSVLDRGLLIIFCGILLYIPFFSKNFTIQTFVQAQILTLSLSCVVAYALLKRNYVIYWRTIKFLKVVGIIKQGLPYALLIFFMAVFLRIDNVLLDQLMGSAAVGKYAGLFRFLDMANNMTGVLMSGMLLSFFGKHFKDEQTIAQICKLCNVTLIPAAIIAPVVASFYANDVFTLLKLSLGIDANIHLAVLMLAYPAYCLMYIYSTLLTALGQLKQLIYFALLALVINIVGNLILIPMYGILGACIMHAVTISFYACATILGANKYYQMSIFPFQVIGRYLVIALAIYGLIIGLQYLQLPILLIMCLVGVFAALFIGLPYATKIMTYVKRFTQK